MNLQARIAKIDRVNADVMDVHAGEVEPTSESSPGLVYVTDRNAPGATDGVPLPVIHDEDRWALDWIDISRLQAISEAFDDDASGFVTISEVNQLTSSRPIEWR